MSRPRRMRSRPQHEMWRDEEFMRVAMLHWPSDVHTAHSQVDSDRRNARTQLRLRWEGWAAGRTMEQPADGSVDTA